ncbi:hypothetical protein Tco_0506214 [Tanacetum coccineum]
MWDYVVRVPISSFKPLTTNEIFEEENSTDDNPSSSKAQSSKDAKGKKKLFRSKTLSNMKRGFSGEHTPLFPSMLAIQAEEGEGSGHPSKPQPPPFTAQPTNEEPIPNVTSEPIPNVPDEAVYKEWDFRVERDTTTAASLDAEQASGNINRTQSTTIPNVPLPQGIGVGGSPRCQEAMGGSISQTRSERVLPTRDSPLPRVHTIGSDEDSMTPPPPPLIRIDGFMYQLCHERESLERRLKQTKQVFGVLIASYHEGERLEKIIKTKTIP